ncbi:MAG: DUF262 domain-containing protein [Pseudomonadales bacterium]|jgi:hypothetical protein|nr:DUF262 domain-containing protein [Pseudomonadales bacterium]
MATEFDDLEVEDNVDEEEATVVYDIASYPSDFTLAGIAQMWKDGDIEIPNFQREFVWKIKQSSLLIDSFLCGLPVPSVFFYIDENNKNLVIDGQQRILSVVYFLEGYFGSESIQGKRQIFRLSGLDERSPYYNKRFIDLDEVDQRKLKQSVLRAVNIRQLKPKDESTSAYHIFERLNTGGTPLKPQEIRNCVFRGALSTKLKEANKNPSWRKILGKTPIDKHQKDVEILLRLFALFGAVDEYEKPMKEFLNGAMKRHVEGASKKTDLFFSIFPKVTDLVISALGEKPFHLRGPLNTSALDAVMCVLIERPNDLNPKELAERYKLLREHDEFRNLTILATTDTKILRSRFHLAKKVLFG